MRWWKWMRPRSPSARGSDNVSLLPVSPEQLERALLEQQSRLLKLQLELARVEARGAWIKLAAAISFTVAVLVWWLT